MRLTAQWLREYVLQLNLVTTNGNLVKQRLITRVYLLVFFLAVFIPVIYTSLINHPTVTVTVQSPSLATFKSLSSTYPQFFPHTTDFRRQAIGHFRLIEVLCQLADGTIENAIQAFGVNQLMSTQPLDASLFYAQMESVVDQYKTSLPKEFVEQHKETLGSTIFTAPVVYGNCSCATRATCSQSAGVYDNGSFIELFDFSIGCYPLEALLQSSLLCLFNTTRVQLLDAYFPSLTTAALHLQVLSTNRSSHYESNTTVESFPNQLLVEQWITKSSYDAYYAQCAPRTCIFTYVRRSNPLVLVTTV